MLTVSMAWEGKTRQEVERELLETLEDARERYEGLRRQYTRMFTEAADPGVASSDGTLLLAQSLKAHPAVREALERYSVALKRFGQVVIYRKLPED